MAANPVAYLNLSPGEELHRRVRAGLILAGTSIQRWAEEHDRYPQNVHDALWGRWTGPTAEQVVAEICADAGLTEASAA